VKPNAGGFGGAVAFRRRDKATITDSKGCVTRRGARS